MPTCLHYGRGSKVVALPLDIPVPDAILTRRRKAIPVLELSTEALLELSALHESGTATIDTSDPSGVLIRMPESSYKAVDTRRLRRLSDGDIILLEAVGGFEVRPRGRFLTMHKRRRKRLTTRALQDTPGLLDDIHHGQVQCVLDKVWQWPFNAFTLDTATGGRSLPVLCVHLFHWYGLMDHFQLDVVRIWKFFSLVEEGYHSTNPYHNAIHATDVTQAMHCFLQEEKIREHLTPLEIMTALIAAVTHDLDHPGVNQPFLIATSNHLAALYENTSVLENHHWRSAIGCLLESHVAEQLAPFRPQLEQQISSLILATDITRQQEFLSRFKKYLDEGTLDMRRPEDRHFILQIALKCADISNPCRPWDVSRKWSQKVCEEFFRQGDYERQLNLPVTSLCDRQTTSVPKIQVGFFRFVVAPLFEEWHRFLDTRLSHSMMGFLRGNQAKWEALIQQEIAEETKTEISEAEEIPDEVSGVACGSAATEECTRRTSLPGSRLPESSEMVGRRHSVPLSAKKGLTVPCTIIRRESLPTADPRRRFTLGPILLFEEDEEISFHSSYSSGLQRSSETGGDDKDERPVSAENLLPDYSIATITSSNEASRLSSVLHGGLAPPAKLTRQQTFPPVQPYVRPRYMSTTAEMQGSVSSPSDSSNDSVHGCASRTQCQGGLCSPAKRDCSEPSACSDKTSKKCKEKENVDPDSAKLRRVLLQQGLSRRRGSAPAAGADSGTSLAAAMALRAGIDRLTRRGSMPAETSSARQSVLKPLGFIENFGTSMQAPVRRSSLPYEPVRPSPSAPLTGEDRDREDRRSRRVSRGKKVLRRRSSGGPETFSSGSRSAGSTPSTWRRGSLPIEALTASLSGSRSNSMKDSMRH